MLLTDLKRGEKAKVSGFTSEDIPAKFFELGIVPGAEIEYKMKAPFSGPVCIALCKNDCMLALRKAEAQCILVNKE
ncbi:ferrous iron transport protein A [Weeksellaceae bacterium TAE3-ERU29]|nr:ferrous iron transport protein A [Weeksellaceae bacterium TAE3-ERU29]